MSFLNLSYQHIHFRHPSSSSSPITLPTLPSSISRSYIPTSLGDLEILHTSSPSPSHPSPSSTSSRQPALFFIHGGMGSASVWLEYLSFFSSLQDQDQKIPCYAVSTRGHGGSWYPSYLRMVYGTTKGVLAGDVVEGIRWAVEKESERLGWEKGEEVEMVLVGHSSGGGLTQYILSAGLMEGVGVRVKGLVLMGAVPGFGSLPVYLNWFSLDPLFSLRLLFHLWHPNSPLSHPALVRRVFFSEQLPESYLLKFMSLMNRYESFLWPLGMGWTFADPERILLAISGWGESTTTKEERVLIIAGEEDRIMTQDVMQKLAQWYREAYRRLVKGNKIDGVVNDAEDTLTDGQEDRMGISYTVVPGAGHHCQNDVGWEVGAGKVLEFYQGLL